MNMMNEIPMEKEPTTQESVENLKPKGRISREINGRFYTFYVFDGYKEGQLTELFNLLEDRGDEVFGLIKGDKIEAQEVLKEEKVTQFGRKTLKKYRPIKLLNSGKNETITFPNNLN